MDISEFGFIKPASYQIKVKGILEERYSAYMRDMHITVFSNSKKNAFTQLSGIVSDQSALFGILNSLFEMHLPVISVELMKEKKI